MRPLTFSVLKLLADGDFHSGAVLARSLQVSRACVWNALDDARDSGLEVERVHGRGYRLREPLDWLDADRIADALAGEGLKIRVVDCCGSTNEELLRAAEAGVPSGRVLVAELQTRGRGRLGRVWHGGLARALTFSLLWRSNRPLAALGGLSLAVGVGLARALERHGVGVALKWPNDLLFRGRKLGGILIEIRGDALGPCAAVIGIGLNVRIDAAERARIDQPVAALSESGVAARSRTEWLIDILRELQAVLSEFDMAGFAAVRSDWMRLHAYQDRVVCLTFPDGKSIEGIARGVDDAARLLLDTEGGVQLIHTGDVSLRSRA